MFNIVPVISSEIITVVAGIQTPVEGGAHPVNTDAIIVSTKEVTVTWCDVKKKNHYVTLFLYIYM